MPNEEKPQDFELIELLIKEASFVKGDGHVNPSTQPSSEFKSFKARFQSYIDQIPSYLHSVGKEGFFPHFFLGSFSTFIDTEVAKGLKIKKIYFCFDNPKTLKVAVVRDGGNEKEYKGKGYGGDELNLSLFVISESGKTDSKSKKFTYDELEDILNQLNLPAQSGHVRDAKDRLQVRSIEIAKTTGEISIKVENEKLGKGASATYDFKEIKKGLWSKPESDIAKLTNSDKKEVKKSLDKVLEKVSKIHSKCENVLVYADQAREAAHHGFIAGALVMNFRYRSNLRVYLEQFAGRGYADIVLVPRGDDRSLNAIPIIIELKAGKGIGTTPDDALEQAKGYAKGFQPNVMRVLTTADDILCVGVNFDHHTPISEIVPVSRDQEITPLFNEILGSIDERNKDEISEVILKERIHNNVERIYYTFPGTGEKGDHHYFSRFLLGQSLLLNEALKTNFEKHVFIYDENVPTEAVDSDRPQRLAAQDAKEKMLKNLDKSHGIVTMVLIPESTEKLAYVVNIIETDGRVTMMNKVIPLFDKLGQKIGGRRVVKLDLNFNVKKQKFEEYFSIEISQAIPLEQYNNERPVKFQGNFKSIPYPNRLKEMFDEAINSQCATAQNQLPSIDKYKELFKKIGAGVYPFKDLIEKEAHTQAVLDGVFSCYSDIRLEELPENRALVLTEFQTGRGKRIDMLVHGIGFAEGADDAKKCIPIGSEIKGPREGMTSGQLLKEGKRQLPEYVGVMYKSLTDGDKVALTVVVFNKEASGGDSLFLIGGFVEKEFSHSSIGSRDSRQVQSLHFNRKQQEVFSQFVSHKFPNVFIKSVKQGLYLPSFEKRGMSISGKCVAITWGLSQALLSQSSKSFLNSLEASARVYERMAQHMQVSKREEREVFALSKLLDSFERKLDSSTSSLPLNLTHAKGYKTLSDLSNYIAGIRGDFAIHLVTSNHVIAIYRTGNSYAYFDSNVAFISGLKSVDQLIVVVERGIKSANYKVEEKGLLVEHFDVAKANNLLSSEDKQILAKEIKTEHQLLEEQDKELGLIKINGQGLSRVQLYDFGAKFNVEGSIPVLINVDMKLSSKKFQEHLDKKEVSMVAREYLDHFKNGKNMEETAKFIPFEGSKREIEEAEQIHKPKRSLSELVKGTINYILAAVSLSRSESQLPGKTDNKPKTYLNDPIIDNQMRKSPGH